jgi:hypothetical protein
VTEKIHKPSSIKDSTSTNEEVGLDAWMEGIKINEISFIEIIILYVFGSQVKWDVPI